MELLKDFVIDTMNLYDDHIKAVKMLQKLYPAHKDALEKLKLEIESRIDSLEDAYGVYEQSFGESAQQSKEIPVPKTVGFKAYESTAPKGVEEDEDECYD